MAFSTAAEVKDSDVTRLTTQASWVDADIEDRIEEGDEAIKACLLAIGFDMTLTPIQTAPLLNRLSILYARAAVLRDLFHRGPTTDAGEGHEKMFERFDMMLEKIKAGTMEILDSSGVKIETTLLSDRSRVATNTGNVPRALTMGAPESQSIDECEYTSNEVLGEAQDSGDCEC